MRQRFLTRAIAMSSKRRLPSRLLTARARRKAKIERRQLQRSSCRRCLLSRQHFCSDASSSEGCFRVTPSSACVWRRCVRALWRPSMGQAALAFSTRATESCARDEECCSRWWAALQEMQVIHDSCKRFLPLQARTSRTFLKYSNTAAHPLCTTLSGGTARPSCRHAT
jgi:hypothetical protein